MEIEVSKKVRAAIKAKLLELGVHVDEELPDYVMVLIANRRTKIQMEQDLNLFLADNTTRFVIWLHHVLKKLEEVTANLPSAVQSQPSSTEALDPLPATSSSSSTSPKKSKELPKAKPRSRIEVKLKHGKESSEKKSKNRKGKAEEEVKNKKRKTDAVKDEGRKKRKSSEDGRSKSKSKERDANKSKHVGKKGDVGSKAEKGSASAAQVAFKFKAQPVKLGKSDLAEDEELVIRKALPLIHSASDSEGSARDDSPKKPGEEQPEEIATVKPLFLDIGEDLDIKPPDNKPDIVDPTPCIAEPEPTLPEVVIPPIVRSDSPIFKKPMPKPKLRKSVEDEDEEFLSLKADMDEFFVDEDKAKSSEASTGDEETTNEELEELRQMVLKTKKKKDVSSSSEVVEKAKVTRARLGNVSQIRSIIMSNRSLTGSRDKDFGRDSRENKEFVRDSRDKEVGRESRDKDVGRDNRDKDVGRDSRDSKDKDRDGQRDRDSDRGRWSVFSRLRGSRAANEDLLSRPRDRTSGDDTDRINRHRDSRSSDVERKNWTAGSRRVTRVDLRERIGLKRERSESPEVTERKSMRSLVVKRVDPRQTQQRESGDEEEYDPSRPAVSIPSVVHVTSRPKREPKDQANKKLLLIAMADAQKSVVSRSIQSKALQVQREIQGRQNDTKDGEDDKKTNGRSRRTQDKKPSIRDRLGIPFRRGAHRGQVRSSPLITNRPDYTRFKDHDLDAESFQREFMPSKEDLQMIVVKVPITTSIDRERNVTLETMENEMNLRSPLSVSRPYPVLSVPKQRISIQVNVTSDESSEEEYELIEEIQQEEEKSPEEEVQSTLNQTTSSNASDEEKAESPNEVSEPEIDKAEAYEDKIIIEEVEEIEMKSDEGGIVEQQEESDDDEYAVVIRETNTRLPDPDEYYGRENIKQITYDEDMPSPQVSLEVEEQTSQDNTPPYHNTENTSVGENNQSVHPRVVLKSRLSPALNNDSAPTKFVVTMNGQKEHEKLSILRDEEPMETTPAPRVTTQDLRSRMTGILQNQNFPPPKKLMRQSDSTGGTPYPAQLPNPPRRPTPYLPITGHNAKTSCKYWPECTFKDKCIYPHPKCKYGGKCTKTECPYKHDKPSTQEVNKTPSEEAGKQQCKFFPKCHSMSCQFFHPSPCRFGMGCTDPKCKNFHPGVTVGQQRVKGQVGAISFSAKGRGTYPKPPAAHLLRWKAPVAPGALSEPTPLPSNLDSKK